MTGAANPHCMEKTGKKEIFNKKDCKFLSLLRIAIWLCFRYAENIHGKRIARCGNARVFNGSFDGMRRGNGFAAHWKIAMRKTG